MILSVISILQKLVKLLKTAVVTSSLADALVYVYNISSFFIVWYSIWVQYFSINFLAILRYISKARYFLSGQSKEEVDNFFLYHKI